ncbi:MAG: ribonuclease E/G [Granulosicoccus sp.]
MKGSVTASGDWDGRRVAARLVDGQLDDLILDPPDDTPLPGAIYRAICDRPMKGQGGITLRLSDTQRGFLRQAKGLRPGQPLLVQVVSFAEPGKAVPVTTRVLFKSRFAIATPGAPGINVSRQIKDDDRRDALLLLAHEHTPEGAGLILRSRVADAADDLIAEDIARVLSISAQVMADEGTEAELLLEGPDAHTLAWRDWSGSQVVADGPTALKDHEIDGWIEAMQQPRVDLSGGAYAFIEPTRALVAIDVNTGGDTSPAAGLKANLAMVRALPRALRCRGLGGQITIDFAPLAKRDRRTVESALRAAFRNDQIETALVGWTPLGHFELQRKRERAPVIWPSARD